MSFYHFPFSDHFCLFFSVRFVCTSAEAKHAAVGGAELKPPWLLFMCLLCIHVGLSAGRPPSCVDHRMEGVLGRPVTAAISLEKSNVQQADVRSSQSSWRLDMMCSLETDENFSGAQEGCGCVWNSVPLDLLLGSICEEILGFIIFFDTDKKTMLNLINITAPFMSLQVIISTVFMELGGVGASWLAALMPQH